MPQASRETASESVSIEGDEGRFEHVEGGDTIAAVARSMEAAGG
jgi:hypothetical protein